MCSIRSITVDESHVASRSSLLLFRCLFQNEENVFFLNPYPEIYFKLFQYILHWLFHFTPTFYSDPLIYIIFYIIYLYSITILQPHLSWKHNSDFIFYSDPLFSPFTSFNNCLISPFISPSFDLVLWKLNSIDPLISPVTSYIDFLYYSDPLIPPFTSYSSPLISPFKFFNNLFNITLYILQ